MSGTGSMLRAMLKTCSHAEKASRRRRFFFSDPYIDYVIYVILSNHLASVWHGLKPASE